MAEKKELVIILQYFVEFKTSKGKFKAELFVGDVPKNTENFMDLVKAGFYEGLSFFKKIEGFIIQAGCPNNDGTGGPGHYIKCELDNRKHGHARGVISMAHTGRDMNGSQFFICLDTDNVKRLDGNHTCIGKVVDNDGILDNLQQGDIIEKAEIKIVRTEKTNF